MSLLKFPCKVGALLLSLSILAGCASSSQTADYDQSTPFSNIQNVHVQRQINDQRGLEKLIAAELSGRGKTASYGEPNTMGENPDAIVTYIDKWYWDITNYLLELTIFFEDPNTGYKFAEGRSFRTSLVRKSPPEMVEEVIDQVYLKANAK